MRERNNLVKFEWTIRHDHIIEDNAALLELCDSLGEIYSYIVYRDMCDAKVTGWRVCLNVSETERYNTLDATEVAHTIIDEITCEMHTVKSNVVLYGQPSLEIFFQTAESLVDTLANQVHTRWPHLEQEDLKQWCKLTICELYHKGYYLHKSLIARCFNNMVLQHLNKNPVVPLVNLDEPLGDTENSTVRDVIPDTSAILREEAQQHLDEVSTVFAKVRDILVKRLGERRYKMLYDAYSKSNNTDAISRKEVHRVANYFAKMGYTYNYFLEED